MESDSLDLRPCWVDGCSAECVAEEVVGGNMVAFCAEHHAAFVALRAAHPPQPTISLRKYGYMVDTPNRELSDEDVERITRTADKLHAYMTGLVWWAITGKPTTVTYHEREKK
jgi:hypothetical protein